MREKGEIVNFMKIYGRSEGVRWGSSDSVKNKDKMRDFVSDSSENKDKMKCFNAILLLLLLLLFSFIPAVIGTECDVTESGLDREGREVGAAYVSCTSGRVVWKYPRNGLRILMHSPLPGREFRACIKADSNFGGARVMVEGEKTLIPLVGEGDLLPLEQERCVSSYQERVALYLEAHLSPSGGFNNHIASFEYDVQTLPKGLYYHPDYDCQPCTDETLLQTFCTADFVATGILSGVDHITYTHNNLDAVNHLTPSPIPTPGVAPSISPHLPGAAYLKFIASKVHREPSDNKIFDPARVRGVPTRVSIPQHCGMKAGVEGEYLLMGRVKLGTPTLQCVPLLQQFKILLKRRGEDAPCFIKL